MDASSIRTDSLRLIAVEPVHVEALSRDKRELAEVLGVAVPMAGPSSRRRSRSRRTAEPANRSGSRAIGATTSSSTREGVRWSATAASRAIPTTRASWRSATRSPPNTENRGFATEAVRAMIGYAFAHAEARVEAVVAHTFAETNASNAVLRKGGMPFVAEVDDPEVGKAWRWRISRDDTALGSLAQRAPGDGRSRGWLGGAAPQVFAGRQPQA